MGCKLVTANNKNRMAVRFKVKIELPYDPEGPLLGLSPVKARIKKTQDGKSCIAVLFTIARTWTQPKCPSTDEWIKKMWDTYTHTHTHTHTHNGILLSHKKE